MASKKRERNETEHWKARVRSLEAEVRSLKKDLARAEKKTRRLDTLVDERQDEEIEKSFLPREPSKRCPECGGGVEIIDFPVRILIKCGGGDKSNCGYSKWEKK